MQCNCTIIYKKICLKIGRRQRIIRKTFGKGCIVALVSAEDLWLSKCVDSCKCYNLVFLMYLMEVQYIIICAKSLGSKRKLSSISEQILNIGFRTSHLIFRADVSLTYMSISEFVIFTQFWRFLFLISIFTPSHKIFICQQPPLCFHHFSVRPPIEFQTVPTSDYYS